MAATSTAPALAPPTRRVDRPLLAVVLGAGIASAAIVFAVIGDPAIAAVFLAAFTALAVLAFVFARVRGDEAATRTEIDWALVAGALDDSDAAVAITDRSGRLVCANRVFTQWFPGLPAPPSLPLSGNGADRLKEAGRTAWRDGEARTSGLWSVSGALACSVRRVGKVEDHLAWRIAPTEQTDLAVQAGAMIAGEAGRRLGAAGVMIALVDGQGRLVAANRALIKRAGGAGDELSPNRPFVDLLVTEPDDYIRLAAEGDEGNPLRLVQIPLDDQAVESPSLFLLLDEPDAVTLRPGARSTATVHIHGLLAMLPLGLALAGRDGRLLFMNEAFERAAGIGQGHSMLYPSDLVVKEDKAAVSDAVRRFAAGQRVSGDLAVRLLHRGEEPVALTIAGARGLGEAAVLLSLKDNSEESKLKRQVAQATKMQAVGQLAGGVAHDFNNILTAIIGHCDLMLLRHTPGDSDYDDIQQIRQNSNRAAGLTRQLLAFSRQQTLRPQVLQLPDVISEISNLVRRLLGETVTLTIKHGRNLGAVRADPGQLEQVIVNLAVNARDAMPGGGTLTLQTYSVNAAQVRELGSEVLPVGDYTALSVSDTGTGIPPEVLPKIFEPFFTTKEVGKGTGLGLSTVYGIVKQSGGFIFADSKPRQGTTFVIYLPVHRVEPAAAPKIAVRPRTEETWGSGTVLLVEDEDMVRAVAERALSRQGYTVITATNGEEALEVLGQGRAIDLLVSDVVMPTMDGPTMVREARRTFPDLPVLFMSGYAEEQLRKSIDLDRVAFLPKPFSVQQLAEAARDTLATKQAGGGG